MTDTQNTDRKSKGGLARRDLFRAAGLGAGALGAAGIGAAAAGAAAGTPAPAEARTGHETGRYRETDHVRTVYALSRF